MKSCRKTIGIAAALLSIAVICVTFFQVTSAKASDKLVIRLAHNQAAGSEIADSIALISDIVAEDASMNMEVQIYPSGVLGTEKDIIEMVKAGILDMAKVSSNTLGQFKEEYSIFAVPYLFNGQQHYYDAMQKSEKVKELFMSTEDEGYIAIGYYANGARNFYLKEDKPCVEPSALKGKKIRSMPNTTSMDMIEAMGGTPVPMAAGETYASLQQGIVDGAENTELALTVDGHQDLVKSYTYTEHQYSPDIYIISTKTWNRMTREQQDYLVKGFEKTNENFKQLYNGMMDQAMEEAESNGVHVYRDIDKTAFIQAVQPIHNKFCMQSKKGESKMMKILNRFLETVLAILVALMVVGCFWQVITRFLLHNPSKYTEELLRYMLIWLTMLGVPYAYGKESHLSINLITRTFKPKNLTRTKIGIEFLVLFISVFVMIAGGVMVTLNSAGQISPAMELPMQVYYICVPISGVLMVLYCLQRLITFTKELKEEK